MPPALKLEMACMHMLTSPGELSLGPKQLAGFQHTLQTLTGNSVLKSVSVLLLYLVQAYVHNVSAVPQLFYCAKWQNKAMHNVFYYIIIPTSQALLGKTRKWIGQKND